ncbi:MAG TPA: L-2-hydroxyglutarate oxidase [Acidimicrobiaceae bacterium]|nr:L-2-hydroxyglutarate oxidase [Acidimicrobiaceae bacterium]
MDAAGGRSARVDLVVVGAGIIGLATARHYLAKHPGRRVFVVEAEPGVAVHQSGRNSGVLHSGVYYSPGSLKARLTVAGRRSMVEFCERHEIAHDVCGKVIVATSSDELDRLHRLARFAESNGVPAELLDAEQLAEREPHCVGVAALWVASTGITDYPAVCAAMADELRAAGAEVRFNTAVVAMRDVPSGGVGATTWEEAPAVDTVSVHPGDVWVRTNQGDVETRQLVNCAGLHSDTVAKMADADEGHRIVPFRGEYFELVPHRRHLVRNLVYPVPDPQFPFLGVHLTRMIDGSIHAGPNVVLALHREGYTRGRVSGRQVVEHVRNRGLRALVGRHGRMGAKELWRSRSRTAFARALAKLVPDITAADLVRAPAGIRAQAMDAEGRLLDDFAVTRAGNTVHVLNAPSPAATASLEIGDYVVRHLDGPGKAI